MGEDRIEELDDGVTCIVVEDEHCEQLRRVVLPLLEAGQRRFVIDLGSCRYLSSLSIAAIIALRNTVEQMGGRLLIAELGDELRAIFAVLKLERLFDLDLDREAAVAAARGAA